MKHTWDDLVFWKSPAWASIQDYLKKHPYFPRKEKVFRALELTPLNEVKVVILGQDPYHTPGMATGLAFSADVPYYKCPPTLLNIFKEYQTDLKFPAPATGDLSKWAQHGVLLLNRYLTVSPGNPDSHSTIGWQDLTNEVIKTVFEYNPKTVFVLWGSKAHGVRRFLDGANLVESVHPSPLSAHRGFLGSRPFTKVNALLHAEKLRPIDWTLPSPI